MSTSSGKTKIKKTSSSSSAKKGDGGGSSSSSPSPEKTISEKKIKDPSAQLLLYLHYELSHRTENFVGGQGNELHMEVRNDSKGKHTHILLFKRPDCYHCLLDFASRGSRIFWRNLNDFYPSQATEVGQRRLQAITKIVEGLDSNLLGGVFEKLYSLATRERGQESVPEALFRICTIHNSIYVVGYDPMDFNRVVGMNKILSNTSHFKTLSDVLSAFSLQKYLLGLDEAKSLRGLAEILISHILRAKTQKHMEKAKIKHDKPLPKQTVIYLFQLYSHQPDIFSSPESALQWAQEHCLDQLIQTRRESLCQMALSTMNLQSYVL